MTKKSNFPENLYWGTASSAYQTEGTSLPPSACESIWDTFNITHGIEGPKRACDALNHITEDINLLKNLGVNSYRFSLSWCRLQPEKSLKISEKALDKYKLILEKLNENKITPFVTLYHWDLPSRFQNKGGWENRDTAKYFAEYTEKTLTKLGDGMSHVITINEPYCVGFYGHFKGLHAPGLKKSYNEYLNVIQNLLFAHGLSVHAIRAATGNKLQVGIALSGNCPTPATETKEDKNACKRRWNHTNGFIGDLIFKGKYPQEPTLSKYINSFSLTKEEHKVINSPIDFLGLNVYQKIKVIESQKNPIGMYEDYYPSPGTVPVTDMGWPIDNDSIEFAIETYIRRYFSENGEFPIMITENGAAFEDKVRDNSTGSIKDTKRIEYLKNHLESFANANKIYPQLKGYFLWSLLDNFEWNEGFSKKFGLVEVDTKNMKRIPKDSYDWYKDFLNN